MQPHPTLANKPPALRGLLYDFWWDVKKLRALDLPVRAINTAELLWHLDLPYWKHEGRPFQITPRQVWQTPEVYPEQYARTQAADVRYPIIVREDGARLLMVDGVHRLLKTAMAGSPTIRAAFFRDEFIPLILHD
ncbi:MAG TPA: hypothetical protein VFT53_05125 [Candidatus Saccharimonadales bacterium]|nr:hypothetical protein [Candidatus Saccharimonadales bacterium]